ncbi:hypothetical protein [Actinoplanes regularis]|uniref:hypothetical protein n=1 Tax=Actinoplanes regularis TaxID=52697 RepID=UPI0025551484|nr:hypothetical protein [Actinoplanes regularis]
MTYPVEVPAAAVASLTHLVGEFADELGEGPPTLSEFLDILDDSIPVGEAMSGMFDRPRFAVTLAGGRRYRRREVSRAAELNDAVYVHASGLLAALADAAHAGTGKRVPLNVLAAGVAAAIRASHQQFADAAARDVVGVTARGRRIRAQADSGDVIAIPAGSGGGYHMVVALNKDSTFGLSVGALVGRASEPTLDDLAPEPMALPYGQYIHLDLISSETWPIVGRRDDLRSLWLAVTEVYYTWPEPEPGSFASAGEPPGDTLRLVVDEDEARAVGILDGSYRQNWNPVSYVRFLDQRNP